MKRIYTAHATAVGGRNGHVETDDKSVTAELSTPGGVRKKAGIVTNPEQLFASAYAGCFGSAMEAAARKLKIMVSNVSVTAHVSLLQDNDGGYDIAVTLETAVPGLDTASIQQLMEKANEICPYSRAVHESVHVELKCVAT